MRKALLMLANILCVQPHILQCPGRDMGKALFALAALLLLSPSFAGMQELHRQAEEGNSQLAAAGWHRQTPREGEATSAPTVQNPYLLAAVEIISAHPSVSNEISSLRPPRIYWGWAESHARHLQSSARPDGPCPPSTTILDAAGDAYLKNASATFLSDGIGKTVVVMESPVATPLTASELDLEPKGENGTNQSIPVLLNVTLAAEIAAPYLVREQSYGYACSQSCPRPGCKKFCSCILAEKYYTREFIAHASASKSFPLQTGNATFLLLSPALGHGLSYSPSIKALALTSRKPSRISLLSGGREFASLQASGYGILRGPLGEAYVARINETPSAPYALNAQAFGKPSSAALSSQGRHLRLRQSFGRNTSLLYAVSSPYPAGGESSLGILFEDEFGDSFDSNFTLFFRSPTQIRIQEGHALLLDNGSNPVQGAALLQTASPTSASFAGSGSLLPSSLTLPAKPQELNYASLWPIAALALLVAFAKFGFVE